MKVAVPTTEDDGQEASVSSHFGRTEGFTLVDTETGTTDFIAHSGGHGPDSNPPPFTVFETDAEAVLAGQIGRGAVSRLREKGITVFHGADGTVSEAITRWEAGELVEVEPEDVHGHGNHDHGPHGDDHGHEHGHEKGDHDHGGSTGNS